MKRKNRFNKIKDIWNLLWTMLSLMIRKCTLFPESKCFLLTFSIRIKGGLHSNRKFLKYIRSLEFITTKEKKGKKKKASHWNREEGLTQKKALLLTKRKRNGTLKIPSHRVHSISHWMLLVKSKYWSFKIITKWFNKLKILSKI